MLDRRVTRARWPIPRWSTGSWSSVASRRVVKNGNEDKPDGPPDRVLPAVFNATQAFEGWLYDL
eukprot:scaffold149294_cov23-Prasinocladus_malaysianus.AAC.1